MTPSTVLVLPRRARAAALPVAAVVLFLVTVGALAGAWGGSGAGVPLRAAVSAGAGHGAALTGMVTGRAQAVRPTTRNGAGATSSDVRRFAAPSGVASQSVSTLAAVAAPDRAAVSGTVPGGTDPAVLPCRPRAPGEAVLAVPRPSSVLISSGGTGPGCSTRAPPIGVLVLAT